MKKISVVLGLILVMGTDLSAQSVLVEEVMALFPMDQYRFDSITQTYANNTDGHFIYKLSSFETQLYHRAVALIKRQYSVTINEAYMVNFIASNNYLYTFYLWFGDLNRPIYHCTKDYNY
jgi:hypothetical protein